MAASDPGRPAVMRTPDERFLDLPEYAFVPRYLTVPDERFGSLRMHYLDQGPPGAPIILLLHGQGCWCYLYRRMIPLFTAAGFAYSGEAGPPFRSKAAIIPDDAGPVVKRWVDCRCSG